jgi:hypothetical protein
VVIWHRQRIKADPDRGDGHDRRGIPGDCLRACVATLTGEMYSTVPHFALYPRWWWDVMRTWARGRLGADFACLVPVDGSIERFLEPVPGWSGLLLGTGPSPRGPFRHVVVVDRALELVHDPHPSDDGLERVDEVYLLVPPYDDPHHPVLPLTLMGSPA